ncbi:hypothetical protein NU195Hw_g5866t1 [Hortaea werneckii]
MPKQTMYKAYLSLLVSKVKRNPLLSHLTPNFPQILPQLISNLTGPYSVINLNPDQLIDPSHPNHSQHVQINMDSTRIFMTRLSYPSNALGKIRDAPGIRPWTVDTPVKDGYSLAANSPYDE